jgi:hypothetical protein
MSMALPSVRVDTNRKGNSYLAGLYGSKGAIQKLKRLGAERTFFSKINKLSATIVANNARKIAPVMSGALQSKIKPFASKRITQNNKPSQFIFGGLVVVDVRRRARRGEGALIKEGKSAEIIGYGKRTSLGMYRSPERTKSGEFIRQAGNPYLRTARTRSRPAIAALWTREMRKWLAHNGIDTYSWDRA